MVDIKDSMCELEKRVFALKLIAEHEIGRQSKEFNSWLGLLFDSIDLLDQALIDLKISMQHHSSVLSDDIT